jgi:hypothetical protein
MTDDKEEQAMLWRAALKEIGSRLKRDLQSDKDVPARLRELIAQIEANGAPKKKE